MSNSAKWTISFCDTHAEVLIWRRYHPNYTPEQAKDFAPQEVKIESNTGSADVRQIGVAVAAILNGESDLMKLTTENEKLKWQLARIKAFLTEAL